MPGKFLMVSCSSAEFSIIPYFSLNRFNILFYLFGNSNIYNFCGFYSSLFLLIVFHGHLLFHAFSDFSVMFLSILYVEMICVYCLFYPEGICLLQGTARSINHRSTLT